MAEDTGREQLKTERERSTAACYLLFEKAEKLMAEVEQGEQQQTPNVERRTPNIEWRRSEASIFTKIKSPASLASPADRRLSP